MYYNYNYRPTSPSHGHFHQSQPGYLGMHMGPVIPSTIPGRFPAPQMMVPYIHPQTAPIDHQGNMMGHMTPKPSREEIPCPSQEPKKEADVAQAEVAQS